jgi:hypothetical protein
MSPIITRRTLGTVAYLGGTPFLFERFGWAWGQLIQYNYEFLCGNEGRIQYNRSKVSYHEKARNELSQSMLGDWILMLDTDHEPPPDLTARMLHILAKYRLEVLVGLYQIKVWPYAPLLYQWAEPNNKEAGFALMANWTMPEGSEIFKIAGAGGGCLMVRRHIFYRILTELDEMPFSVIPPFSEDLSFFWRLDKLGIDTYCCPNIESPHLYIDTIRMEHYDGECFEHEQRETKGMSMSKG